MAKNENPKAPSTPPILYTDEDLMALFKVTASCLYRWRRQQEIPFIKVGNCVYYSSTEIEMLLLHKIKMSRGK